MTVNFTTLTYFDVLCLGQSVALSLPALQGSLEKDDYRKWEAVGMLLGTELSSRGGKSLTTKNFRSNAEKRVHTVLARAFDKSNVVLTSNEYLFDLFEADMVFRVPSATGMTSLVMNIEVNGIHHLREKKKRFCALRDEYLKSRGVVVIRIEVSALRDISDEELRSWILDRLASELL